MAKLNKNQIINLSSKMDNRANNEVLNLNPDETGMVFFNLENADLYNTKALKNRKGVEDLCNGVVNGAVEFNTFIDVVTSGISTAGSSFSYLDLTQLSSLPDYPVTAFVPSGNMVLFDGSLTLRSRETIANYNSLVSAGEENNDVELRGYLFKLDQAPVPASGSGFMSGTRAAPAGNFHDLALNTPLVGAPFMQYEDQTTPLPTSAVPIAVCSSTFNFGQLQPLGSLFVSNNQTINWKFEAPVAIDGDVGYAIRWVYNLPSGNVSRNVQMQMISNAVTDLDVKSRALQEFTFIGSPANQNYALRYNTGGIGPEKTWVHGKINEYINSPVLDIDYSTSDTSVIPSLRDGVTPAGVSIIGDEFDPINGTPTADFGQVFILPSGLDTYYGAYFHANLNDGSDGSNITSPYTADKNIGVRTKFYEVLQFTGTLLDGDYATQSLSLIAEASGNFTFPITKKNDLLQGDLNEKPNYDMNKIYVMFDNPVSVSGSGANTNHLITFGFYDYDTGADLTDVASLNPSVFPIPSIAYSPFRIATETQTKPAYSGNYVLDYSGNGFAHPSGVYPLTYPYNNIHFDLTCGLVNIVSDNAIQGIYDYRIGTDRVSQIVYGQAGEIRFFDLDFPDKVNHTVIHTGSSIDADSLYTYETYDDLMFSHQYSQISGQFWDQTNANTSDHGQRPTFEQGVATSGTMVSGVNGGQFELGQPYSVMISNGYSSGGQRSSIQPTMTSGIASTPPLTASSNFIEISGLSNQFDMDVPANHMFVWVTAVSGSSYFLANVYDMPDTTAGTLLNYPLNAGIDVVYIERPANPETDQSTATVTTYDNNYFLSQVNTPKFKKIQVYYDYLLGIGDVDFPSRLWHSENGAPQIWGESFNFHGFIDVDKDNGSPLTAMAKLREYLMLFKENSTYRIEFLGDNAQPFAVNQVSDTIGSLGVFGVISVDDAVYGLCQYGVFMTNGASVEIISDAINPYFNNLDHTDLAFAVAVHDKNEDKIIWSIANNNTSESLNDGIMLNYKEKSFSVRKGGMFNAANVVGDDDNFDVLLGGTINGQIQRLEVGNTDQDTVFDDGAGTNANNAIQIVAETPWMSIGDSQIQKQFRNLDVNIDGSTGVELQVEVMFDQDETVRYTRFISLAGNNPDKRTHLGGQAKTVKFRFKNVGLPDTIKIKSLNIYFQQLGLRDNY